MGVALLVIILETVFQIFLFVIIFFQLFFIINVLFINIVVKQEKRDSNIKEKISVLIPLLNSERTIGECLNSILNNDVSLVESVIIVLDHCVDRSADVAASFVKKFNVLHINLIITNLPNNITGKVNGIKHGIDFSKTKNILLLDADIILKNNAVSELLHFHLINENSFSSCLVYPHQAQQANLISKIICQDRLYRQNIIKTIKNKYGVANFPGSIGIVDIKKYKPFLFSGFLEDLTASFHVMGIKDKISILPMVLGYEMERESLKGVFFQRVRWSIGNIENIPLLTKTIIREKSILKKILIFSYPTMWYLQHYAISMGLIFTIFFPENYIFLLPLILYIIQIILSNLIAKESYNTSITELVGHCLLFPFIISGALISALVLIIKNKKLYFKNDLFFKRI